MSEGSGEGHLAFQVQVKEETIKLKGTTTCMACMKCIIPRVSCNLLK